MYGTIRCKLVRLASLGLGLALGFSPSLFAQELPSTGLGEASPHAPDVSKSPRWHVYVFARDGIRYFQINDASGTVRGAIATAHGTTLVLPIGKDASRIQVKHLAAVNLAVLAMNPSLETVYKDSLISVMVSELDPNAAIEIFQNDTCENAGECGHFIHNEICENAGECGHLIDDDICENAGECGHFIHNDTCENAGECGHSR